MLIVESTWHPFTTPVSIIYIWKETTTMSNTQVARKSIKSQNCFWIPLKQGLNSILKTAKWEKHCSNAIQSHMIISSALNWLNIRSFWSVWVAMYTYIWKEVLNTELLFCYQLDQEFLKKFQTRKFNFFLKKDHSISFQEAKFYDKKLAAFQ